MIVDKVKDNKAFVLVCAVYLFAGLLLALTWYRYQLNPDATSYFSIAYKYAHLDVRHAVNGYWGPMLSWLLVPAVWLHANLIISAKLISLVAGLATLVLTYTFMINRGVNRLLANIVCVILGVLLITVAMTSITPDVLMTFFFVLYAFSLVNFTVKPTNTKAVGLGAIGAALYFTKGFGFYFFIAVTLAVMIWQSWNKKHDRRVLKRYLLLFAVFAVIAAPFITVISVKYCHLTINTAGNFDRNLYGPASGGTQYPMVVQGPFAPPNGSATSVWEDPTPLTPLIPGYGWNPLGSAHNRSYFIHSVLGNNFNRALQAVKTAGLLVVLGFFVMGLGCLRPHKLRREYAVFTLISATMILAYSLVYLEARYIGAAVVLAATAAGLWLSTLERQKLLNKTQIAIAGTVLISMALATNYTLLSQGRYVNRPDYEISKVLKPAIPDSAGIVSDNFYSINICYHAHLRCYGVLTPPVRNQTQYAKLLKKLGAAYYLQYDPKGAPSSTKQFVLQNFTRTSQYQSGGERITLYKLN